MSCMGCRYSFCGKLVACGLTPLPHARQKMITFFIAGLLRSFIMLMYIWALSECSVSQIFLSTECLWAWYLLKNMLWETLSHRGGRWLLALTSQHPRAAEPLVLQELKKEQRRKGRLSSRPKHDRFCGRWGLGPPVFKRGSEPHGFTKWDHHLLVWIS